MPEQQTALQREYKKPVSSATIYLHMQYFCDMVAQVLQPEYMNSFIINRLRRSTFIKMCCMDYYYHDTAYRPTQVQ